MQNRYIIANWKQNMNLAQISDWLKNIQKHLSSSKISEIVKIVVCPSFVHLPYVNQFCQENPQLPLICMAQDVSIFSGGSHTGQVAAAQIKDYVEWGLVGHSETNTSPDDLVKKIENLLAVGITPAVCFKDLKQFPKFLLDLPLQSLFIWEDPVNISVNGAYNSRPVNEIALEIKGFKQKIAKDFSILYGGSVNRQNAKDLGNIHELSGVIVGHASLDPEHFLAIVQAF